MLDAEPFWDFQTQIDIVLACCIIHNHIMRVDPNDSINQGSVEEDESSRIRASLIERQERQETREWTTKRDEISQAMWNDFIRFIFKCYYVSRVSYIFYFKNYCELRL